jgi:hypothetical protein
MGSGSAKPEDSAKEDASSKPMQQRSRQEATKMSINS